MATSEATNTETLPSLHIDNVQDGETIHQRCLLIRGRAPEWGEDDDYLMVIVSDEMHSTPSEQSWPMHKGYFKALIKLKSGTNNVSLKSYSKGQAKCQGNLRLNYSPLMDVPPLHLAILVTKDSPLLIDCPPHKAAGYYSAHASLEAAIAKFRVTAYMWQAVIAEDMHSKGLGRRSFRLDEEWAVDTTSQENSRIPADGLPKMGSVPKVHIVRTERTMASFSTKGQMGPEWRHVFEIALANQDWIVGSTERQAVAGMILDMPSAPKHQDIPDFRPDRDYYKWYKVLLGCFGSHLTFTWPRYFEEITSCLTDIREAGHTIYRSTGGCDAMWEACSYSQFGFLREVARALGAPCFSPLEPMSNNECDWVQNFLVRTAWNRQSDRAGFLAVDGETENYARFSYRDCYLFRSYPQFRLPGDRVIEERLRYIKPTALADFDDKNSLTIKVRCPAGIAKVNIPGLDLPASELEGEPTELTVHLRGPSGPEPISAFFIGSNGQSLRMKNIWKQWEIPGGVASDRGLMMEVQSARAHNLHDLSDREFEEKGSEAQWHKWRVLLKHKNEKDEVHRASEFEMKVGRWLEQVTIRYADGTEKLCGPPPSLDGVSEGGRESKSYVLRIGEDARLADVLLTQGENKENSEIRGIKMKLTNGRVDGDLNLDSGEEIESGEDANTEVYEKNFVDVLSAPEGHEIIGFYGRKERGRGGYAEFGILTAPSDTILTADCYDMLEL